MDIKLVGAHPENFAEGRGGQKVRVIVIHATEGSLQGAAAWFNNPKSNVSAHIGVAKNGSLEQ